jgi:hypothetical protein
MSIVRNYGISRVALVGEATCQRVMVANRRDGGIRFLIQTIFSKIFLNKVDSLTLTRLRPSFHMLGTDTVGGRIR